MVSDVPQVTAIDHPKNINPSELFTWKCQTSLLLATLLQHMPRKSMLQVDGDGRVVGG